MARATIRELRERAVDAARTRQPAGGDTGDGLYLGAGVFDPTRLAARKLALAFGVSMDDIALPDDAERSAGKAAA